MASAPLYLTPVPEADIARGDGPLVDKFIESYCRVTKESLGGSVGEKIRMRSWQSNITGMIYARMANKRFRHRQALIGLPRKNGKSAIGSSLGVHALVMGPGGSEVYSVAGAKEQARIVFNVAKRMVELDEDLSKLIRIYRDALEYTDNGSIYKVLSAEAPQLEGLNPTCVIFDELHVQPTAELYNVMTLAQGARRDPLLIAITTAGVKTDQTGGDSTCYQMYQQGIRICKGEVDDPSLFMAWWGAPEGADYRDPKVWEASNPGYNDLIDPADFAASINRVTENEFRTKRLNQWVESSEAWLPQGAWDACRTDRTFVPGNRGVVLGFDGSDTGDSTALVVVTVDSDPQVRVLGIWEKPAGSAGEDWRVPRGEVKDAIRQACRDYSVREIAADEYIWHDALEELEDEGLPVVRFPQTNTRMTPATARFYEMVKARQIGHDGDPKLARHLGNAILKRDSRGQRIVKESKNSSRKIDLAVAAVMAMDRAAFWLHEPMPDEYVWKDAQGEQHTKPIREVGFVW